MKIRDFNNKEYDHDVSMCDFENFFDIYEDNEGGYRYNLNETLYLDINYQYCEIFTLDHDMQWSLISYKIYGTIELAWLLCKINKIKNPMRTISAGLKVFYIPKNRLSQILQIIND